MTQYSEFIDNIVLKHTSQFATFDPSKSRVDVLLFDYMASDTSYNKLWIIVKQLLLLSHGQATVERGFSVNRHIEVENITDETVSSRRMICDHMKFVGGITNIDITNKRLLISCSSARQKYVAHLEDEKKKSAATAVGKKRKAVEDEIGELKIKRLKVQTDVDALTKAADDFADKAEKEHKLTLIAQSNAMRRAAKEKK